MKFTERVEFKKVTALEAYRVFYVTVLFSPQALRIVPEDWHHTFGPALPTLLSLAVRC